MHAQKLRLGILLDSFEVPAWAAAAIRRIVDGSAAEFSLVVLNGGARKEKKPSRHLLLYPIFDRLDTRLFGRHPNPLASTSIEHLLSSVPMMSVHPAVQGGRYGLQEADAQAIREFRLDVLIRIGFEQLVCDGAALAKYGVWYYYHGDDTRMSGGPAGFWEVVEDRPETGTALLAVGGEAYPRRVLYRSYFFTYPLSPARHRSYYFWAAASFLPRQIEFLQRFGEKKFWEQTGQFNLPGSAAPKNYETPSGMTALRAIGKIIVRLLRELFKRLFYVDRWFLLFGLRKNIAEGFKSFASVIPSKDRFWADPHAVQQGEKYFVFIEEFLRATNKGHISVMELDESGRWKAPVKVLEQSYHLSYPFVFEWDGRFYMIPESGAHRTIDLYESVDFPYKWEFKQSLMQNVKAVDSTLLHHAGKWWLFTAIAENEPGAPNVELFLFHSDRLLGGTWTSHPQNPIVSDMKRARPAGAIFEQSGKLFRPSQDCSKGYGFGFDLNEIVLLSESEYCERLGLSVRPNGDKKVLATHTYASRGALTMIDGFTHVSRFG